MVGSCEQATQSGGCGFCNGFGTTLRSGNLKCEPSYSNGSSLKHRHDAAHGIFPAFALIVEVHVERLEFRPGIAFAHAELNATVTQEI